MSPENVSAPAVTLGLFDWVDADGVREAGRLYRERLDLVSDAESSGFDIYGSLSYAEARSSLMRFAEEVAPALRELHA